MWKRQTLMSVGLNAFVLSEYDTKSNSKSKMFKYIFVDSSNIWVRYCEKCLHLSSSLIWNVVADFFCCWHFSYAGDIVVVFVWFLVVCVCFIFRFCLSKILNETLKHRRQKINKKKKRQTLHFHYQTCKTYMHHFCVVHTNLQLWKVKRKNNCGKIDDELNVCKVVACATFHNDVQ